MSRSGIDAGRHPSVEAARIAVLFSRARMVYVLNIANALVVAFFLWGMVPAAFLLSWAGAVFGTTLFRFLSLRAYERDASREVNLSRWKQVAIWGATVSGGVWGAAALLLFPPESLLHQIFLLAVIMGMMAGSVATWSVYFPAFRAFFLSAAALTLIRFGLEIQAGHSVALFISTGAMFLFFTAGLYVLAGKGNEMMSSLLLMRGEKAASDGRYQALFEGAKLPMLLIDPADGRIVDANAAAEAYYGYAPGLLARMNIGQINTLTQAEIAERMAEAKQQQQSCFHFRHHLASGEVRDVEVHSGPVMMHQRHLLYSVVHDITERKLAEKEVKASHRTIDEDRKLLQAIVDNAPIGKWLLGANGRLKFINRTFCDAVGIPEEHFLSARHYSEVLPEGIARNCMQSDRECLAQAAPHHSMEVLPFVDGKEHQVEITKVKLLDEEGRLHGLIGMAADATERIEAERSMKLASLVYQSSSEGIMVTDENNVIIDVNPAFTRITGYTPEDVVGRKPGLMKSGLHDAEFYQQMWQSIHESDCWQGEVWDRRKDGELYAQWINISVIRHPDGRAHRYVGQFSDITEKKQKDETIWRQANYDMLTNLPNRRLFRDRLERELKKYNRNAQPLALLFIDLDRFKEVNDSLGHDMGDQLLVEAALRISECVRETDTVARLGGDEFTVILPELMGRAHVERIAQDIIASLNNPFVLGAEIAYISASIGITLYPEDAGDLEGLLKNADQAMYAAKSKGRNRFGYYTESMQQEVLERISLTNDLRLALMRNELELYYQPIIEISSGRIVKAEALLRWKHEVRGMVAPAQFIPLAEESGLIREIGSWVFHAAVADVERWRQKFGRVVPVSVNKSPVQFCEEALDQGWLDKVAGHGLPDNSIAIEITEGVLLKEMEKVRQRLRAFHEGGIEVSIDDFGTGFSSLSYLQQLDIDYLKIDRSFIQELAANENGKILAEAIITMAHKLNIRTIAEGVETEAQHELLARLGCDFAQGYLYSKALPAGEFETLLETT